MRSIKYQYFLSYAVLGSVAPYASVYLEWRGLSDAQIGLVMSLGGLAALLMPAMMSLLADLKMENRALLRGVFIGTAIALSALLFSQGIIWLLPAFLMYALSTAPSMSLNDGLLFSVRSLREAAGQPSPPYHRIRVFGTLGFIAPSFVLYLLMDGEDKSTVRYALVCGIVIALIAAANTFLLPRTRGRLGELTPQAEVPDPHPPAKEGKPLPTMLALRRMCKPDVALFCVAMWMVWIPTSAYYTFYPLYLKRVIGVEDQWLGLISSLGVVPEIFYILSFGWLLKKLGARWLLTLGIGAVALRMGLLWAVPTLSVALGTQLLHGMTILAIFVLPPLFLNHCAEPAYRNSMQGLFAMLVYGTGRITGNILSGQIAEAYDGDTRMVFAITAGVAVVATLLFALFFRERGAHPIEP